ncbi:hypothetical protein SAMN05421810_103523 [Amycolatopsis arida]|uniref:4-amino-4-deoxy-L-arabinose transferase n=1 Tax=Amycolatopsis arida TaxID=587909 RepID=A0A1I5TGS2_9PSEU|nr:hypothetical protein [Amycolatopsis arida]TDX96099.1 hypothetical protein CLV69_103234 [Amycolatopsis arida]SFP82225.1 hypothetical protein SAMN05421810_103523 [Amycolatopsis arida]
MSARWAPRLLHGLAVVPVLLAAVQAARAPRAHLLLDYWHVLAEVTDDTGRLLPAMLLDYHLDQPFVVPSLLFWVDAALLGADNRVLTLLTVALLAGTVLLLRGMLPADLGPARRAALTAALAFLLLAPHAAELWLQSTNGISWVPALSGTVLAVFLAHRDRFWSALAAAGLAVLCFGAALPAFFLVATVAWLRGAPSWRVVTAATLGVLVVGGWLLTRPEGDHALATSAAEPDRRLAAFLAVLGAPWSPGPAPVAVLAGTVVAGLAVLALARGMTDRTRRPELAGWVGVVGYALALAALVALGRTTAGEVGVNVGTISRYAVVGGLAAGALLVLGVLHRPRARHVAPLVLLPAVLAFTLGIDKAIEVRSGYDGLGVVPVALRVAAPAALREVSVEPAVVPAARALGAYPFTTDFTLGCAGRELGDRIDVAGLPSAGGTVDTVPVRGDTLLSGWAVVVGAPVDCVLVVDERGTVSGGGITGVARSDAGAAAGGVGDAGFRAVAAPAAPRVIVVVARGGALYRVPPAPG